MHPITPAALLSLFFFGCAVNQPRVEERNPLPPHITIPNGSSPAKANAPHAPMNDSAAFREGWNHGNGTLWILLPAGGSSAPESVEKDSFLRAKFGWWRGKPGRFTIQGRRLDAPAPPLRTSFETESRGAFGFTPSYLYFSAPGLWEITGDIDGQNLTFVIQVNAKP